MKEKYFKTVTPEGIKPKLETHPLYKKNSAAFEKALLFCSYLWIRANHFNNNEKEDNPYQRIRNDKVRIILGDKFKEYKDALVKLGIIEIDSSYIGGNYSMGYRLTEEYINQKEKYRKIKKAVVQNKLFKLQDRIFQEILRYYPYLEAQLNNMQKIFIDFSEAMKFIQNNEDLSSKQKRSYIKHVYKIGSEFKITASVSRNNKRFSSTFTNLPKLLRPFLYTIDLETGELLFDKVEIDGSNTQPLMLLVNMQSAGYSPEEELREIVLNGTLYDTIADRLQEDRNWVKKRFMDTLLYTENNSEHLNGYHELNENNSARRKFSNYMESQYPKFYKWLLDTKHNYAIDFSDDDRRNPGGSALAIYTQFMESRMWIHTLLPRIPENITYITIHDSIMLFNASQSDIDYVYNEIKDVAREMYNIEDIPLKIKVI